MHENLIFSPITGGGRTPGTPYAGSATDKRPHEILLVQFSLCVHKSVLDPNH